MVKTEKEYKEKSRFIDIVILFFANEFCQPLGFWTEKEMGNEMEKITK